MAVFSSSLLSRPSIGISRCEGDCAVCTRKRFVIVCASIRPSIHHTCLARNSMHAEAESGRNLARSGLIFCLSLQNAVEGGLKVESWVVMKRPLENGRGKSNSRSKNQVLLTTVLVHGVQEQTIGRKKCSRLLTWEKVFFDALAINLWQKLKNRLGNIEFKA